MRQRLLVRWAVAIAVIGCAAGASLGCASAGPQATLADERWEAASPDDAIVRLRSTLRLLETHPRSDEARRGLDRARGWLERAEAMAAVEEVDAPRLALVLAVAETQLVEIKAWYDRAAAAEAAGVDDRGSRP